MAPQCASRLYTLLRAACTTWAASSLVLLRRSDRKSGIGRNEIVGSHVSLLMLTATVVSVMWKVLIGNHLSLLKVSALLVAEVVVWKIPIGTHVFLLKATATVVAVMLAAHTLHQCDIQTLSMLCHTLN